MSQKKFTRLASCAIKGMKPILKTEMLIYQSKAKLAEKILLGKIIHYLDPEIRKMLVNGKFGNEDPHSILVHDLLAIELKFYFLHYQCKFRCRINHGPQWNVEFSIPIQTPYRYYFNYWALKMSDFTSLVPCINSTAFV